MTSKGTREGRMNIANLLHFQYALTPGETRVAILISDGLSYAEIAAPAHLDAYRPHAHQRNPSKARSPLQRKGGGADSGSWGRAEKVSPVAGPGASSRARSAAGLPATGSR